MFELLGEAGARSGVEERVRARGRRELRSAQVVRSTLEQRERLEQLRALEAGMRIDVAIVDTVPLGVDTPEDLETARAMLTNPS